MKNQDKWPATEVVMMKLTDLKPNKRNARVHSEQQIEQVMDSMRQFGWTMPMLADDKGTLIAGHCRREAALRLEQEEGPVMVAKGWTPKQKRQYMLADNQLTLNASWDQDILKVEIESLLPKNFDGDSFLGFDVGFVHNLLGPKDGNTDPDDVPDTPERAVTIDGDLWLLGNHRLVCGDCTSADDVAKCLGGVEPHLMVTDPPYGVEYDANWRNGADRANGKPYGASAIGKVSNDDKADWSEAYSLFPGDVAYVWHPAGAPQITFGQSLQECGFDIRMVIIWAKNHAPIGRGHYHVQHEPCYYAVRKRSGATGHWNGSRKETTLWKIDKPMKSETGHSTQKPVECMRRPIVNNSSVGQAVYDPFLGSGTTMIAAEMEGRHCYGLELHPPYCDVIIKRWQDFTGLEAKHESGKTFEQISMERYDWAKDGFACYEDWCAHKRAELQQSSN